MPRSTKALGLALLAALALLPGLARAFNLSGERWSNGQVVMQLQLGPTDRPLLDGATSWNAVAEEALSLWNSNLSSVRYTVVRDSTAPAVRGRDASGAVLNNVFFSPTVYGDAWGSNVVGITLSTYDPRTLRYSEADVLFNSNVPWDSYRGALRQARPGVTLNDFRRVALHEFGHALGLNHPDDVQQNVSAIMNARSSDVDTLTADDIAGVRAIYENPNRVPATLLSLQGSASYSRLGSSVTLSVDKIQNDGDATSGTVRLELWAMPQHYENGIPAGSRNLGTHTFPNPLAPGQAISGVNASTTYTDPPNGSYYVALVLTEFTGGSENNGYTPRHAKEFPTILDVGPRTAPAISTQPAAATVLPGATATFTVVASGGLPLTYQWRKDGVSLEGATKPALTLPAVSAASAGSYSVVITNSLGSITSAAATLAIGSAANPGRLINMSIRTNAGTGDSTLIVGVGLGGAGTNGAKAVLLRAVGPTLGAFGVGGALGDPVMTVFQDTTAIAQNDDWAGGFDFASVGAFNFSGAAPRDAAIYNPALAHGSYSIQIAGKNGATGVALAEIYDATAPGAFASATPRLVNVSARAQVGTGDNLLIAGFVVGGSTPVRVLVRAVGPTLGAFGVGGTLANPKLDIFGAGSARVDGNDDWGGTAELKAAFASVGAFALSADNSRDAAVIATLAPGGYTAQVSGVGGTTGVALVELYELP